MTGAFFSICLLDTLESGIDVGQGINIGPGIFGKKNKSRAYVYSRVLSVGMKSLSRF